MQDEHLPTDLAPRDQERFYSIEEAAEELGVSPSTVRRRVKRGQLQAVQARIAQGYEWRIRLRAEDKTPNPSALVIRQPLSLEETRQAMADALSSIAEELATTRRALEEKDQELGRLREVERELLAELELARTPEPATERGPWWRRLLGMES